MRIYPAIDLKGGRVVRLEQGRADRETVYYKDPAKPAAQWRQAGADWMHVVDLDGAFSGSPQNEAAIEAIVASGLKVQLGGGLRTATDVARAFGIGVARVVLGTRAAEDPSFVHDMVQRYGERIAVGIDAKDGWVAVRGWVEAGEWQADDLAREMDRCGVSTLIYTDISRDGMLSGPNFAAQEGLLQTVGCRVIASGGVSSLEDIDRFASLAKQYAHLDGVIIGKALYDGRIDLKSAFP